MFTFSKMVFCWRSSSWHHAYKHRRSYKNIILQSNNGALFSDPIWCFRAKSVFTRNINRRLRPSFRLKIPPYHPLGWWCVYGKVKMASFIINLYHWNRKMKLIKAAEPLKVHNKEMWLTQQQSFDNLKQCYKK